MKAVFYGEREVNVFLFLRSVPLDWTHSRTDHSIYFQVRMKGRLQTMHVVHSVATLFKRKKKKKTAERVGKGWRGGALHKFYIHKAADKVIVASPKLFFFSPPENTFPAE